MSEEPEGLAWNTLLPYADKLPEEAQAQFQAIKQGIAESIAKRELAYPFKFWCRKLNEYLKIHQFGFSREEHIAVIKAIWSVLEAPDVPPATVSTAAQSLYALLKKRRILPSDALVLPWRVLYDKVRPLLFLKLRCPQIPSKAYVANIVNLVEVSRRFFPPSTTDELLEEVRPYLCPQDQSMFCAATLLTIFIPTDGSSPAAKHPSFLSWIDEAIHIWQWVEGGSDWDMMWMNLFARLARRNFGTNMLDAHLDFIFTKILRWFNLPVGSVATHTPAKHSIPANCATLLGNIFNTPYNLSFLTADLLSPNSPVKGYVERLVQAVQGFCHPSNTGAWSPKIGLYVYYVIESVTERLQEEARPDASTPAHLRLTVEDRKWLVTTMRPVVFLGQFSKSSGMVGAATWALKGLAYLSPEDIIPQYLESAYPALQTLTETHQTVSALTGLAAIARPMFSRSHYPEGAAHLMPLLHLALPGIDMNDFVKSQAAFQFFGVVFNTVPLVDCSMARAPDGASERDLEVYASTSGMEEFVSGYLDRIFEILKTQVAVSKKSSLESFLNTALNRSASDFFQQLSPALFEGALDKVFRFVTSHILLHTAKTAGFICAAAATANPDATLRKLLPFIADRVVAIAQSHATVDDPDADENEVTEELLWYLHILARLMRRTGAAILAYKDRVVDVLSATLPLAAKKASKLAGKVLRQVLKSLTDIYLVDRRSATPAEWARITADPIGVFETRGSSPGVRPEAGIRWHVPTRPEYEFSEELVRTFFDPAHKHLQGVVARHPELFAPAPAHASPEAAEPAPGSTGSTSIATTSGAGNSSSSSSGNGSAPESVKAKAGAVLGNKARLRMSLVVVRNTVRAGNLVLPESTTEPLPRKGDVQMNPKPYLDEMRDFELSSDSLTRRDDICATMSRLAPVLLACIEDDTKTFSFVVKIITELLLSRGFRSQKFSRFLDFHRRQKQTLGDVMRGDKFHTRMMIAERAYFQHLRRRVHNMAVLPYNAAHKELVSVLILLSTSRYAVVRRRAQTTLNTALVLFTRSKGDVFDHAISLLDPARKAEHHQIKGSLYLVCLKSMWRYFVRHLEALQQFVVHAAALHTNAKNSVQVVVAAAFKYLSRMIRSIESDAKVPEACFDAAVALFPALEEYRAQFNGQYLKQSRNQDRKQNDKAQSLMTTLLGILTQSSSHWRYELMMASMLSRFFRTTLFAIPEQVVRFFASNMAHDSPHMRALAVHTMNNALTTQKAIQPKRWLAELPGPHDATKQQQPPPPALCETPVVVRTTPLHLSQAGPRADNQSAWFRVAPEQRPQTAAEYDNSVFFDKNYFGWSGLPQQVKVNAPFAEASLAVPEKHAGSMAAVLAVLQDDGWLANMLELVSQERSDGTTSSFNDIRAEVYKGIFRNFGLQALAAFKPQVELLCADADKAARQRSAAEIIAGLVRGMKHWHYDDTTVAWGWLIPLLQKTLVAITNDAVHNWAAAIRFCVYDKDPRRMYPLLDLLFTLPPLEPESVSAASQHRALHFLSSGMEELSWRGTEASRRLLTQLEPFLAHPYKLVRERIARSLFTIFRNFWSPNANGEEGRALTGGFVDHMLASFEAQREAAAASGSEQSKQAVVRFAKTIAQLAVYIFNESCGNTIVHRLSALLPVLFTIPEVGREDVEMVTVCTQALGLISQLMIPVAYKDAVFAAVLQAATHQSWHVRRRALLFMQVSVFRNFFVAPTGEIVSTLLKLLSDEQVEIRELASVTLSGVIRCGMCDEGALRTEFYAAAKVPVRKMKRRRSSSTETVQPLTVEERMAIVKRHSGILGLNAFLLAYPYTIPPWMPELLVFLADKTNDPEPIRSTVKKAMGEFWRTHQDTWRTSKHLFTEDQVITITDLLISPSYYA